MTNSKDEARAIFDRAIEHTRGLSPATFDQWFGGVQFDDLTDGVLTLRVQNEFVLEWVKTNFLPTLTDKIREMTGWSVQVAWTVDQHLEAPISNRAQISPVRPRALVVRPSSSPPTPQAEQTDGVASSRPVRRAAPPDEINPKHTFASFVVGPSNQLAHAAAIAAAGGGGRRYNPLFICGGTGLGKTHLVHAIAHRVSEERPSARIIYVSAERFTHDFITAIQHHRMDEFRARSRAG